MKKIILELLPSLNIGVIVRLYDISLPKNYLKRWLVDEVKFWNEQYFLEAFLTHKSFLGSIWCTELLAPQSF